MILEEKKRCVDGSDQQAIPALSPSAQWQCNHPNACVECKCTFPNSTVLELTGPLFFKVLGDLGPQQPLLQSISPPSTRDSTFQEGDM